MLYVFIIGATGYLGGPVTRAIRRDGHIVTALIRPGKEKEANEWLKEEVLPVFGDAANHWI